MFDLSQAILLSGALTSDMSFVRCEEEVSYCQKRKNVIANVDTKKVPTKVDLALWYFERPYLK